MVPTNIVLDGGPNLQTGIGTFGVRTPSFEQCRLSPNYFGPIVIIIIMVWHSADVVNQESCLDIFELQRSLILESSPNVCLFPATVYLALSESLCLADLLKACRILYTVVRNPCEQNCMLQVDRTDTIADERALLHCRPTRAFLDSK